MRIDGRHEQPVTEHAEAAVDGAAAVVQILGELSTIAPDRPSRARVDGPGMVVEAGHVQHAIDDDRGRLEAAERAGLERPLRTQLVDVLGCDLGQRAMPLAVVLTGVGEPSRRILETVEQILRCHAGRGGLLRGQRDRTDRNQHQSAHMTPC